MGEQPCFSSAPETALRQLVELIKDFGKLSGGALRAKYDADPMDGFDWLVKQARRAQATVQAGLRP